MPVHLQNLKYTGLKTNKKHPTILASNQTSCISYFTQNNFNFSNWNVPQNEWYIENCQIYDEDIDAYTQLIYIDWYDPNATRYYDMQWLCSTPDGSYTYHPRSCSWSYIADEGQDYEDT